MIYLSYLVFIAVILFLYFANDLNLRRRDLAQARIIWFAVARKVDGAIADDLRQFAALTRENPTPELIVARDHYLACYQKLAAFCAHHRIIAAILRCDCRKERVE